ncbi:MAG TPA: uracil-DNA glycosylase [Saprospiraceae bacterium]|nr:uracil-DNA glycosylase [Saprospiraceae bacterium]
MNVQIEPSWGEALQEEFDKPYFQDIVQYLKKGKASQKVIFPPGRLIFQAFAKTPFNKVKVVILGQDPYHRAGQAMGLSFSVPVGVTVPPSLKNIYKELQQDIGFIIPDHGDLTKWAEQGVFLLNAFLTVEQGRAASHQKIGWDIFTDAVIKKLSDQREHLIFLLWGRFAQAKAALIDETKHYVLTAFHPSPLAGNRFAGCAHFSKTNELLKKNGMEPIHWQI